MKENLDVDTFPSMPSEERDNQQGRFDDMESRHSLTKSSLDLGWWVLFLLSTNCDLFTHFFFKFVCDEFLYQFLFTALL